MTVTERVTNAVTNGTPSRPTRPVPSRPGLQRKPWSLFIHDLTVTRATLSALPLGVMDGGYAARAGGQR